jgi:hypothetical protein
MSRDKTCSSRNGHWEVKSTEYLSLLMTRYLVHDLAIARVAYLVLLHPVQDLGKFLSCVHKIFILMVTRMLANQQYIFILTWERIMSSNNLPPEVNKMPDLLLIFVSDNVVLLDHVVPVNVACIWSILKPQKAMNIPTSVLLPFVPGPKVDNFQKRA